jgi:plasmid stabilization system protein ParE
MAFRVEISPRAFADLDAIAGYIKELGSFDQARKWFNACRCPIANAVRAFHVRHRAQRRLSQRHPA